MSDLLSEEWGLGRMKITRRHLPHWELEGSTYYLTFCVLRGTLSRAERNLVLEHVKSGDGRFYALLGAIVMPDHAHAILKPKPNVALSRIVKGVKGVTARRVNQQRGARGPLWQDEYWDRIIRDQEELRQKLEYMLNNSVRKGLVEDPWRYDAWFFNEEAFELRS
ncbi:MAG: hypothetical protein AMS16_00915 [Planctomycetes bacterium DG_58]|nr:MAG: hypothetical protein AMS16_00915 [Planctomycetes bacterium DG_58]